MKPNISRIALLLVFAGLLAACGFQKQADEKFGDQHFKTAISLIELHKVRFGSYPEKLGDLRFTGDWDLIALNSIKYQRVDDGYTLEVTRGWVGAPVLQYPPEFYQGLGLRRVTKQE